MFSRLKSALPEFWRSICRKKIVGSDLSPTPLDRCLSTIDLSFIAIGCMLGSGVYIFTGEIAGEMAGPGGTVSVVVAGLVALLAALCYVECAVRYPDTGASFIYAYVSFGEVFAFVIGWNAVILRILYVVIVSRCWSGILDDTFNRAVGNWTVDVVLGGEPWDSPLLGDHPDFLAAAIILLTCALVAFKTSLSAKANTFFVIVNITTILIVFVVGLVFADFENFVSPDGYFPFGSNGVLTGAAACVTGYCGFEVVAISAEEAKDPSRGIPIGIVVGFIVAMISYLAAILALTAMVPFYEINVLSPFVTAFEEVGLHWMKYVVALGSLGSMSGGIINCMFCAARSTYALARDGLLPEFLGYVHPKTKTPLTSTIFSCALSSLFAIFLEFVSILQLTSLIAFVEFVFVTSCCITLRYRPPQDIGGYASLDGNNMRMSIGDADIRESIQDDALAIARNRHRQTKSTPLLRSKNSLTSDSTRVEQLRRIMDANPSRTTIMCLINFIGLSTCASLLLTRSIDQISSGSLLHICILIVLGLLSVMSSIPLFLLHQYNEGISFKVPLMPLVPLISLLVNIVLVVHFASIAYIELAVWTAIGLVVYFSYGIRHSHESDAYKNRTSQEADDHRQREEANPIILEFEMSDKTSR